MSVALSKLAVRRLTKLCEFMEKLPPEATEHFNMGAFLKHEGDHEIKRGPVTREVLLDCGTTACAMGWAAVCPSFVRAGLQMRPEPTRLTGFAQFRIGKGRWTGAEGRIISTFFNMDDHWYTLFGPRTHLKTPKQWARMCRRFIRKNG